MAHPLVIALNDHNFDVEVLESSSPLPVLIKFGAAWCPPCKALRPIIEQIAVAFAGRLRVAEVDIDDSPAIVRRLGVRGAPTTLVFRDGQPIARQLGMTSRDRLLAMCGLG
jgi:thioredoxin 1